MSKKISVIKKMIKEELVELGFAGDWFYETHLLAVEKFAKELLKNLPKANKEVVMLSVWLHDIQRIRGIKGDHAKAGAEEAEKILKEFNYPEDIIKQAKEIILTHPCEAGIKPKTLEGKILASADAMSHCVNDFYLAIAVLGERNVKEFKKWALEKLNRDYNKKIFFDFAKKMIKRRRDVLKEIFTMK